MGDWGKLSMGKGQFRLWNLHAKRDQPQEGLGKYEQRAVSRRGEELWLEGSIQKDFSYLPGDSSVSILRQKN